MKRFIYLFIILMFVNSLSMKVYGQVTEADLLDSMNVLRAEWKVDISDSGNVFLSSVGDSIFAYLPKPVDTTKLILNYNFDDVTIFDNSIYQNTGGRNGTIHISNFDSLGGGYGAEYFDSTAVIFVGNDTALSIDLSDFAVSFWVQVPESGGGNNGYILNKRVGSSNGYRIFLGGVSKIQILLDDGAGSTFAFGGTSLNDNILHHIAINFDRDGDATLYLDEVIDGTPQDISSRNGYLGSSNHLYIGGQSPTPSSTNLKAVLDELYMYGRLLTIDEIYNLRRNSSHYSQQMERFRKKTTFPDVSDSTNQVRSEIVDTIRVNFNTIAGDSNQAQAVGSGGSVVGYYSFDAEIFNNVIVDDSKSGNNGINSGTVRMTDPDSVVVGLGAIKLNGSAFVDITSILDDVANSSSGMFAAYLKPNDATPIGGEYFISFSESTTNVNYLRMWLSSNGKINAVCGDGTLRWQISTDETAILSSIDFTHVALVHDSTAGQIGTNRLYINGKEIPITYTNETKKGMWFREIPGINNSRIGNVRFNSNEDLFFNGIIDEVIISNDTQTQQQLLNYVLNPEIYNLFNTKTTFQDLSDSSSNSLANVGDSIFAYLPKPVDTTALLLHYPFNDTVIFDKSMNSNTGKRMGSIHISNFDSLGGGYGAEYFSGTSSYIEISDTAAIHVDTSDFAISFWIKTSSFPNGKNI